MEMYWKNISSPQNHQQVGGLGLEKGSNQTYAPKPRSKQHNSPSCHRCKKGTNGAFDPSYPPNKKAMFLNCGTEKI